MASTRERNGRFIGLYRDALGKQKSAGTYDTEEEALARATVAELDARPPDPGLVYPEARRGKPTVAGYAPGWLDGHRLEPTSRESYGCLLKHIIRELGTITLADLDSAKCNRMFRDLERRGLSSASIAHVRTVLREMCRSAVRDGLMAQVPEMIIGRVHNREMQIATREQAQAIQDAIPESYKLLVETLFNTGCRYGEVTGLGPEHVVLNQSHAVLKIGRRVIVEVGGKPIARTYGKSSNAVRDVVIPLDLGKRLIAASKSGYLVRSKRGLYLSRANFARLWKPACRAAGVPTLRVHDARHSHASWLANDPRMPLAAVRDRLGHSDLKVTSRYIHSSTPPEAFLAALAA